MTQVFNGPFEQTAQLKKKESKEEHRDLIVIANAA
jgi:hypothetical protein